MCDFVNCFQAGIYIKSAIHEETLFTETVSGNNVNSCMIRCFRDVLWFVFPANRLTLFSLESFHKDQRVP